jgi:microcystin-dependent protein
MSNIFTSDKNIMAVTRALVLRNHRLVPPGAVEAFAGSSAPVGWLMCDGSLVSKATYYYLYSVIGDVYGAGDANNFVLPDLRSKQVIGAGNGLGLSNRVLGANGGEENHTLTVNEMPVHNHGVTDPGHAHSYVNNVGDQNTDNAFATQTAADNADYNQNTGSSTTGISINNAGGGQSHNVMDPFLVLNYIIKF